MTEKFFKGLNGTIKIESNIVIIERKKGLKTFFNKNMLVKININDIKSIKYKAGNLFNGFISISTNNSKQPYTVFGAVGKDYTVIFRGEKNKEARKIVNYIRNVKKQEV